MDDIDAPETKPKKPSQKTTGAVKKPAPKKAATASTADDAPAQSDAVTAEEMAPRTVTIEDVTDHGDKSDMRESAWIMGIIPENLRPYALLMRLDRPIGIWLLLLPCYFGLLAGMGGIAGLPTHLNIIPLFFAFTAGAVLMRGAGCIINDLWDQDIDPLVERTRTRPLASGQITRERAMIFAAFLVILSAMILFTMNWATIALGILALALVIVYPFMKRITFWPQGILGLTFNMGILMGSAAISGGITPAAFLIFLGAIAWTICYDTIYACQDTEDDARLGLKSTALLFGDNLRLCVIGFMVVALGFFAMAGVSAHSFGAYYAVLALPALHAFLVLRAWDEKSASSCLKSFKAQRDFGLLVMLALLFI